MGGRDVASRGRAAAGGSTAGRFGGRGGAPLPADHHALGHPDLSHDARIAAAARRYVRAVMRQDVPEEFRATKLTILIGAVDREEAAAEMERDRCVAGGEPVHIARDDDGRPFVSND